jgi:hypothetical protein
LKEDKPVLHLLLPITPVSICAVVCSCSIKKLHNNMSRHFCQKCSAKLSSHGIKWLNSYECAACTLHCSCAETSAAFHRNIYIDDFDSNTAKGFLLKLTDSKQHLHDSINKQFDGLYEVS